MKPFIALVEDNPDNRLLVHAILEDHFEIDEYETGREALEGLRKRPPQLVLLDISLPEMDGTEVLKAMRDDEALRRIPAIALTAHAMAGDRERFLGLGFDHYLTKPIVDDEMLIEAIHQLLASSGGE
jgi:two-component system, cell cycle response regulator DivK